MSAQNLEKERMKISQQIFHNLLEITELHPEYTISQHLAGINRRKDPKELPSYDWSNEKLLERIESYKEDLENNVEED